MLFSHWAAFSKPSLHFAFLSPRSDLSTVFESLLSNQTKIQAPLSPHINPSLVSHLQLFLLPGLLLVSISHRLCCCISSASRRLAVKWADSKRNSAFYFILLPVNLSLISFLLWVDLILPQRCCCSPFCFDSFQLLSSFCNLPSLLHSLTLLPWCLVWWGGLGLVVFQPALIFITTGFTPLNLLWFYFSFTPLFSCLDYCLVSFLHVILWCVVDLVDLTEDLCIFCHHRINHNHSCCVQKFSSPFPSVLGLVFMYWNEPLFPDLALIYIIPLRHTSLRPHPFFSNIFTSSPPKIWTLFLSSSRHILPVEWFSCPAFSVSAHKLGSFSTFRLFLTGAVLKWNTLSKELSGSTPFQQLVAELSLLQNGEKSEGTSDWCKQTSLKNWPHLKSPPVTFPKLFNCFTWCSSWHI